MSRTHTYRPQAGPHTHEFNPDSGWCDHCLTRDDGLVILPSGKTIRNPDPSPAAPAGADELDW